MVIYRVYEKDGSIVCALLEVSNTFGGKHYYVLRELPAVVKKKFHVSPFNEIDGNYLIELKDDFCKFDLIVDNQKKFTASIDGKENDLLRNKLIFKFPFYGFKVLYEIHKEAFKIFLKKNN